MNNDFEEGKTAIEAVFPGLAREFPVAIDSEGDATSCALSNYPYLSVWKMSFRNHWWCATYRPNKELELETGGDSALSAAKDMKEEVDKIIKLLSSHISEK